MPNNQITTQKGQQHHHHQPNDGDALVPSTFSCTPLQAQQAVFAAVAALNDPTLTCAFTTALHHQAGFLVLEETPALDFLRREDGNVDRAAQRLVLYWKYRKMVFGADRWLLPLTQTGSGALENSTIAFIRSGVLTYIPGTTPVIVMDLSKFPTGKTSIGQDGFPWAFYMGTWCSNYVTQTRGIQLLHVLNKEHRIEFLPGLWEFMSTALPVKFLPDVLLVPEAQPHGEHHLREYLALQARRMVEYNRKTTPVLVNADSAAGRLRILQSWGMSRHGLPTSLGGTFAAVHYDSWIRLRLSKENAMSATPLVANAALFSLGQNVTRLMLPRPMSRDVARNANNTTTLDTTTMLPGVAIMNRNNAAETTMTHETVRASLSRQIARIENDKEVYNEKPKRGRPKKTEKLATAAELMQQRDCYQEQSVKLRAENRKLMDSLAQARYLVAIHNTKGKVHDTMPPPPPPTLTAGGAVPTIKPLAVPRSVEEFPEHRARVKKPTDAELLEQCDLWKKCNNALRRDNQRLEKLLEQGRSIVARYTNNSNNVSRSAASI